MRLGEFLDEEKGDRFCCGDGCGYGSRIEHWGGAYSLVADMQRAIRLRVNSPVYVLSGARCPRHNAKVAKSNRSQHAIAQALDLVCPAGMNIDQFYALCCEIVGKMTSKRGGCGRYVEDRFVHIDTGLNEAPNRRWDW